MRFRAFPVAVVIDGTLHEPALMWATEDRTEIWVDTATRVATFPAVVDRERVKGPMTGADGHILRFQARFADGSALEVGKSVPCGCTHPLRSWSPPAEVSA